MIVQDRSFTADGQLFYTSEPVWIPSSSATSPRSTARCSRTGRWTAPLPAALRQRSNARIYNLSFSGLKFVQIGAEGGLFSKPVTMSKLLHTRRARRRRDRLRPKAGGTVTVKDNALPEGVVSPPKPLAGGLMQFRVGQTVSDADPGPVPDALPGEKPGLGSPSVTRDLPLEGSSTPTASPRRC